MPQIFKPTNISGKRSTMCLYQSFSNQRDILINPVHLWAVWFFQNLPDETSSLPSNQNWETYIHLPQPVEGTTPNVNYGLWVLMVHQCKLIKCNKHTTLVGDAANGGGCACVGVGGVHRISVLLILLWTENYPKKLVLKKNSKTYPWGKLSML